MLECTHRRKYARIERERRFLLDRFPSADVVRIRHITDRYIDGTFYACENRLMTVARSYLSSHKKFRRGRAERNRG
jgi:hypothetical protein